MTAYEKTNQIGIFGNYQELSPQSKRVLDRDKALASSCSLLGDEE
jgi:hypothetical protein